MLNNKQTPIDKLFTSDTPEEVRTQFEDLITSVPYYTNLTSHKRRYVKDMPKDKNGRVIIDFANPHILTDMTFFVTARKRFEETGSYCEFSRDSDEYVQFWLEEVRRCRDGLQREDGEYITGAYYFFLNYFKILMVKINGRRSEVVSSFGDIWDGQYLRFAMIDHAINNGEHFCELASRGKSKSYTLAAILTRNMLLGESATTNREVQNLLVGSSAGQLDKDGVITKFLSALNALQSAHQSFAHLMNRANTRKDKAIVPKITEFPTSLIVRNKSERQYIMGDGSEYDSLNELNAVIFDGASRSAADAIRGKRPRFVAIDEFATYVDLNELFKTVDAGLRDLQGFSRGTMALLGTAGSKGSDFSAVREFMYNPVGYSIANVPNVYSKGDKTHTRFVYFMPACMNGAGCYDADGNSDITKAVYLLLMERYRVKYNTSDPYTITRHIAEHCLTPEEAIMDTHAFYFPATECLDAIHKLDSDPDLLNAIATGEMYMTSSGKPEAKIDDRRAIREYPLKDKSNINGAIEFHAFPVKDAAGCVMRGRYIAGLDPVATDGVTSSVSLNSFFIFDLYTDSIVCEYTGRPEMTEDFFEQCRLLCIYYNAVCNYENNFKGFYAYMDKMHSVHYLTDTLDYLKDMQLLKVQQVGNTRKGFRATGEVNAFARRLLKEWLLTPVQMTEDVVCKKVNTLRQRALLKELSLWNININADRVSAMGAVMLLREHFRIMHGGEVKQKTQKITNNRYKLFDSMYG